MCSSTLRERDWVTDMTRTLNAYKGLTTRNAKVFLKNRMAVFLSLLTQIIILGLFLLFIKDSYIDGINDALGSMKDAVTIYPIMLAAP